MPVWAASAPFVQLVAHPPLVLKRPNGSTRRMQRLVTKGTDTVSRSVARQAAVAGLAVLALSAGACSDASIGVLDTGVSRSVQVIVDGPLSSLGAWRYYDGVRLLECDIQLEARALSGSSGATAQWREARIDIYDLRTGQYLASDYFYPGELAYFWGDDEIASGERQYSRPFRYTSYGPFRVYLLFRYEAAGRPGETEHRFDCR